MNFTKQINKFQQYCEKGVRICVFSDQCILALNPLKTSEKQGFFDVFGGYRTRIYMGQRKPVFWKILCSAKAFSGHSEKTSIPKNFLKLTEEALCRSLIAFKQFSKIAYGFLFVHETYEPFCY